MERVPERDPVVEGEMQLPALLAHIGDPERHDRSALDRDVAHAGEGKIPGGERIRVVRDRLQGGASIGTPEPDTAEVLGAILDGDVEATVLGHAPHPHVVAIAGIRAINDTESVRGRAQHRQVGAHAARVVEKVRVDTLADGRVAADLGDAEVFHERFGIGPGDVVDGEVRQVDHADVLGHLQVLGIGDAPEVAVVPLGLALGNPIGVLLEQVLVARVTVGALPAGHLHEVTAEIPLALPEWAPAQIAGRGIRLAIVHRRVVDLERRLEAAIVDETLRLLVWVVTRNVDAVVIELRAPVGHPVREHLARAGPVLDPDRDAVPEAAHVR